MANNVFKAYLTLIQLPDEVKKRNGIKTGAKIPRFDCVRISGNYEPLNHLKNPQGQIFLKLNKTKGIIRSPDNRRADCFLGAIGNYLNFSSVFLLDNSIEGNKNIKVGYGNPNRDKTFGKDKKPNPFYNYKEDCFLFLITPDWLTIEILVVSDGYNTMLASAKALADGVYNEELKTMRATATTFFQY